VIKDQLIWISKPVDSNQPNVPDFKLDKVSNDGPEWETEIYVDIVVEVVDNSLNDKYLLIARHQYILKLE
jgi:Uma2 family endonuclease